MPSAATIVGYRVTAYDEDGNWVQGVECNEKGMIASLRLAIEWERQGYIVEHEVLTEHAHACSPPRS